MGDIQLDDLQQERYAPVGETQGLIGHAGVFEGKQAVIENGLEPVREDKEVHNLENRGKPPYSIPSHPPVIPPESKSPPDRKKWGIIIGIVIVIIVIVVCVPVGVIVPKSNNRHKPNAVGVSNSDSSGSMTSDLPMNTPIAPSSVNPKASGSVLQGTRLATMDPRTGGDIYLFYQWEDNGLRYISQSPRRVWQGSTDLHVTDARAGTPLTSVSTGYNESTAWWLFYVDNSDVIQNIYTEFKSTTWRKGNVSISEYKVPNDTNIAFTVSGGRKYNQTLNALDGGMSLYATGTDGTIHEYIFDDRTNSWTEGSTFPDTDGFSGASTWSEGPSSFLFTVSSSQSLEFWFRDYSAASSDDGNRWQLGPSSHADLMQNGSVCGQTGVAFQSSSGFIQGSNFTDFTDPGETRWDTSYNISDQAAINGSAVSVWFFYSYAHANPNIMFQAFYQKDGSEIEEAIRTWGPDNKTVPGTWTYNSVPV